VIGVPEDRIGRTYPKRAIGLDLSSPEKEYAALVYPVSQVFDWDKWQVLENFKYYRVPVITLDRSTSKEAVCVVFEKVNTGGKPLDAFELVTAMYAASGHELRKDWYDDKKVEGRHQRLVNILRPADSDVGILAGVGNTDFLQVVSLFYTRDRRHQAEQANKKGKELPAVSGKRQALLSLPLEAYKKYEKQVEEGFTKAAKFLHMLNIYRKHNLPYQSQIVPLAAILADIGNAWEHEANRRKLIQWYWNGVFGELYGSAVESRIARDFMEVPVWLKDGPEPSTVSETIFRADRLKTMRTRVSAAYKGVNTLLMKEGAQDFRSGQKFEYTVFFGESVDIHHIFPQSWCKKNGIKSAVYDSIINKTPLTDRTNRIIGGIAPSEYLAKLEVGDKSNPSITSNKLDSYIRSHLIDPTLLRTDAFDYFMNDRQNQLLGLIEQAMGKPAYTDNVPEEGEDVEESNDNLEAAMTIPTSL